MRTDALIEQHRSCHLRHITSFRNHLRRSLRIPFELGLLLTALLVVGPLMAMLPLATANASPIVGDEPAPRAQSGQGYRVFATREGLVGGWTSSGHVITPYDYFVSLPSCTTMSCPGASPGRSGMTNCGQLCYVKVTNPSTGACRTEPIYDVGPWFTVDDWWNPADVRFLNKLPSNRQVLPQGLPGAQAAWDGKNVGYGWGPNGIGGSDYYNSVGNAAGIDLADGTYWSLGIGGVVGNWVDVEMLWQTGESPGAAAASCGHQLLGGGGAIPKWSPTPAPTVSLIPWGTAKVTGTGGGGLNCRTAPSGSGTVIMTFPEGATVTLRGPSSGGWYPVICAGQAGYSSASYLSATATPTPTIASTVTSTPTRTITSTTTTTTTSTATSTTTPTATVTATGTPMQTATVSATTTGTATPTETVTATAPGTLLASVTPTATATWTTTPTATVAGTSTLVPSPTASVSPTSTPTAGPVTWGTGTVSNTFGAGVNCRVGPATSTSVIAVLAEGSRVSLTGPPANGWQPVICGGRQGYVSAQYLTSTQFTPTPATTATQRPTVAVTSTQSPTIQPTTSRTATLVSTATATATRAPSGSATSTATAVATGTPALPNWGTGTVSNTLGAGVNCRVSPTTSSGVITVLPEGARVQLSGPATNGWQPVVCGGRQGYVSAQYLAATQFTPTPAPTATWTPTMNAATAAPSPTTPVQSTATLTATRSLTPTMTSTARATETATPPNWGTGTVRNTGGLGVNCRTAPNTSASIIRTLPDGTVVQLTGAASNGWQPVVCNSRQGYVSAQYLAAVAFTPTPIVTPTISNEGAEAAGSAASATVSMAPEPRPTGTSTGLEPHTMVPEQSPTTETTATQNPTSTVEPSTELSPTPTTNDPAEDILPTPTASLEPTAEVISTAYVAWTGDQGLACMSAPSWDSELLMVVPDGLEVTRIGDPIDGWQVIACGDTRGYVDVAYLSEAPVTPDPTLPEVVEEVTAEVTAAENAAEDVTEPPIETLDDVVDSEPQTFTFAPVAETSVLRSTPDVPQGGVSEGALRLGGPDGATVALTFELSGFADGTVVQATLLITGAGDTSGIGGSVLASPETGIDPWSATSSSIDALGGSTAGWLDIVSPGMQSAVDVTGIVMNGTVTFVLTGSETPIAIAGTPSGAGPVLIVTAEPEN